MKRLVFVAVALAAPTFGFAQGDGPRSWLPAPVGTNVVVPMYLHFESNFNFQQTILVKDADIASDVGVVTYFHLFSLRGRLSEFRVTGVWGSVGATVNPENASISVSEIEIPRQSGVADPVFSLTVGLFGAPALEPETFMRTPQKFQGYLLIGAAPPLGSYDSDRAFNLGTNRWAIRLGLPLVVPLASAASRTNLEITPSVMLYTDNTDPFGEAELREQEPTLVVEWHLSRNFTPKLWGSLDLRGQWGGETTTDGVSDDNRLAQLGGGVTLGYQLTSSLSAYGSFGGIFLKDDDSRGTMIRFQAAYVF